MAAATSGLAGFLSAEAGREAMGASNVSLKWQSEATFSYDRGMQLITHDQQLLSDADVQETLGDINHDMTYYTIAENLRAKAYCVEMGYVNVDGTGSSKYNNNFGQAWGAFAQNTLADYNVFMNKSDANSTKAKSFAGEANAYLLATVIMAFGTVVAAAGTTLTQRPMRQFMLIIVGMIIAVTLFYILTIWLGLTGL
ncbi:MAG: hypothetical protein A4E32_02198 [Methanomassiliicoccales archaeon PtaU1.Bin124]|nr:MAG: hypothetical protein A4E32_02198 [Methanomassiliicoccales archaeon PtaU1.Bin124]